MKKIGLISDNHSYFGGEVMLQLQDVDEIWHAGDIGDLKSVSEMSKMAYFRAVYGNIDDMSVKDLFPLNNIFFCEDIKVLMTHIGGYPGRYNTRVKELLVAEKPDLYICGHSHICKVIKDKTYNLLHMNPGAYGHHGFHKIRTILKFEIDGNRISNLRVIELGIRGLITNNKTQ